MKKLDTYLADLLVGNVKLHNLHWNVVGLTFKAVHEYLEDLYDSFFEKFDEVAEYQKQIGVYPKSSVKEYMKLTNIEELGDNDISSTDALAVALDLIKYMKDSALKIQAEAEDFVLSNMMEDHVTEYNKEIWFMESMLR
ncbi:MAG: Dps family protein [Saccharofermentanales bacterium]|jgi:starvation-inducible DNA-binding protein